MRILIQWTSSLLGCTPPDSWIPRSLEDVKTSQFLVEEMHEENIP
jgi:hypothetical protein